MSKIGELLEFNREDFFDGAVQADWFYEPNIRNVVSNSYIFHGPKYFGLGQCDVKSKSHKLIDSISFISKIGEKLSYDSESSRFVLTIAGYGAGKSHLSVAMASLFSGDNKELQNEIINKIELNDADLARNIKGSLIKPNLVIVLNGMNDFNLNYEVLKRARQALKLHNVDDSFLEEMTKAHNTASIFLENAYTAFENIFIEEASKNNKYKKITKENLKKELLNHINNDNEAFQIVNEVYNKINGNYIRWDNGITAGDILSELNKVLCKERAIFNKILVLFDEFGRYIEYTSDFPQQAGESALQQIFESIQNASKNILFVGFIQSDLNAYINRVTNTNIRRYLGRYEGSDKYYLSSNLETILSNLLRKKNPLQYESLVNNIVLDKYKVYQNKLFENIHRWLYDANTRGVWSDRQLYDKVILKGAYPIHPLTTWIMSNLSTWMQQRSTLTFVEDVFEEIKNNEMVDEKLFYVYPTKIIESKLFNELLNAEEKGLQQSQNCILYNSVLIKYGDKITEEEKTVLQAILISNISKFTPYNKEDMVDVIIYCTGYNNEIVIKTLKSLEENYGVIRYDDTLKRFEILAESNGRNEFNRKLVYYKIRVSKKNPLDFIDDKLITDMGLDRDEETIFALNNNISSIEWRYTKKFINCHNITDGFIKANIEAVKNSAINDTNRGILIFVYVDKDSFEDVDRISRLLTQNNNDRFPVIYILINDENNKIRDSLIDYQASKEFTITEKRDFSKFIDELRRISITKVVRTFFEIGSYRRILKNNTIETEDRRLNQYGTNIFEEQYTKIVNFNFDGFEKKITAKVKRYFVTIGRGLITSTITNKKALESLDSDVQNRVKSLLSIGSTNSWKVMSDVGTLLEPQSGVIKEIYDEVQNILEFNKPIVIGSIFKKYLYAPYTLNQYSLGLFIAYFIGINYNKINIYSSNVKVKKVNFANEVFSDKKYDFNNLLKFSIEKVEGNQEDEIKRIIDSVSNTLYIDKCAEGLIKLRELEKEENIEKYLSTLELLKEKMQRGVSIYTELNKELEEFKDNYNKYIVRDFSMKAVVHVFRKLFSKDLENKIKDTNFEYSETYIHEIKDLREKILEAVDNNIDIYLQKSFNFKYDECKQQELFVNLVKKFLINNRREALAKLTNEVFIKKKQALIEENKYDNVFNEFDNFIKMNKNLDTRKYTDLEELKENIKNWNGRISDLNISKEKKQDLFLKIVTLSENINNRRTELDKIRDKILFEYENVKTKEDINELEIKINRYLLFNPEQEIEIKLRNILDMALTFKLEVKQVEVNRNDRNKLNELSTRLKEQFKETVFSNVIKLILDDAMVYVNLKDSEWKNTVIDKFKTTIDKASIHECEEWRIKHNNLPLFLKDTTIEEYKKLNIKIDDKIKSSKIDGIISIFKELDDDEKERCIKILFDLKYKS